MTVGIGDELMLSGQARVLQQKDPRKVRPLYDGKTRWNIIWDNNPRIAHPSERGNFQSYIARNGFMRPYIANKTEKQWTWTGYKPERGEIYFSKTERNFARLFVDRIIIEPNIKSGASPNKSWGWVNWNKLGWLAGKRGIKLTQLGSSRTPVIEGAEFIKTKTFRDACSIISKARAVVTQEGAIHHAAAALNIPAVVIYGGYISPRVTGYDGQIALGEDSGLGCGMRTACEHCKKAMAAIDPAMVLSQLEKLLETVNG